MKTFKEHIVKVGDEYRLVSKKTGKNLGTYPSKAGAEQRERQVQYFKHMKEDGLGLVGGSPTMSAGTGEIAGLGIGDQGEPGVRRKKKKSVMPFKTFFNRNPPKLA
jgi:hypothetical protein